MAGFLVDESLPRSVTRALSEAGHDVVDARDAGLRGAPDEEVHAHSVSTGRIVVAGDTDFANALRFPPGSHPGIVVLRVPNVWTPRERADRLAAALDESTLAKTDGAIVIVEPARVRVLASPAPSTE
jgi:predicted nuclease of predicted toxin-antitoxin system